MSTTTTRELAHRQVDGIEVSLLWIPGDDAVSVHVTDARTGDSVRFEVDGEHALDAFHHPYAYAAWRGIRFGTTDLVTAA